MRNPVPDTEPIKDPAAIATDTPTELVCLALALAFLALAVRIATLW